MNCLNFREMLIRVPLILESLVESRNRESHRTMVHAHCKLNDLNKNRDMRVVICWMMRALFICGGFHHLKVKGRKAETKDAPVLALAPHSSFFDALPVVYLGGPSIVAKGESSRLPFFGSRSPIVVCC